MPDRRLLISQAVLYLVCDAEPDEFVAACLDGGVDVVQLRMKDAEDRAVLEAGARLRVLCARRGALFILNDRPDLAAALEADGVHVGQNDVSVPDARRAVGPQALVGVSTHSPAQVDAAGRAGADYIGVGPVHATPTKPGRAPVGTELVRYASEHAAVPFFAIGGIDVENVGRVVAAGARRAAVVRALTDARDPALTARRLRSALGPGAGVAGAAGAGAAPAVAPIAGEAPVGAT